ncbi:MAG: hypothetical protein ISQ13_04675 [Candidatus Margulisbacteria bacterium]|nr:hypothetical protein [Candidatus Margulisiibacteriota bacterium]
MTNIMNIIVPFIVAGYALFILFRLFLERKLAKERKEYEALIEQKMKALEKDIHDRSRNLHDSVQMLNQEYSKLMRDMSLKQKKEVNDMMQHLRQQAQSSPSPPSESAPSTQVDQWDDDAPSSSDRASTP